MLCLLDYVNTILEVRTERPSDKGESTCSGSSRAVGMYSQLNGAEVTLVRNNELAGTSSVYAIGPSFPESTSRRVFWWNPLIVSLSRRQTVTYPSFPEAERTVFEILVSCQNFALDVTSKDSPLDAFPERRLVIREYHPEEPRQL